MQIKKQIELDYGHTLPNHFSFCNQIHGHRAFIVATIQGEINEKLGDSSQGMLLDFKFLKEAMLQKIHKILDHGFAVWKDDILDKEFIMKRNTKYLITEKPPTAEYLAEWAFYQLKPEIPSSLKLVSIEWFETPSSSAIYKVG